ncbi:MAG: penicillin acylase family protein, partial [Planctomycetes bacterium]|nr:penicillin acylase family protein [Planctomycetota bacterium]
MINSITDADLLNALPDTNFSITLSGIKAEVQITRDPYGIPHIKSETAEDAFFGQGFATAQDRLWHMESDRRRAYGTWAELVGEKEKESDIMMRKFQIKDSSIRDLQVLNEDSVAMLKSYASGVNAFIQETKSLPIEFTITNSVPEKWLPEDSISVYKVRHIMMGVFEGKMWRAQLLRHFGPERTAELLRGYQKGQLLIIPPAEIFQGPELDGFDELESGLGSIDLIREIPESGSNSWVLDGSRTKSGLPLLSGDPHRALDTPNCYYQNHVACKDFDVIGLSFPGCPGFPHFGHNEKVAWCVTHAMADYQDLFIEKFNPSDLSEYTGVDSSLEANVKKDIIKVRDGDDVEITLRSTHHGPIIADSKDGSIGLAFSYTSTWKQNQGFECFLPQMTAQSAQEAEEAMRKWVDPCNNYMFADSQGNIGYLNRGTVPLRSSQNAWLPVPGWTCENDWKEVIPFEELPRSINPSNGYIVTANNKIVGGEYPYYLALDYAPEYRAKRILERIKNLTSATVEDM